MDEAATLIERNYQRPDIKAIWSNLQRLKPGSTKRKKGETTDSYTNLLIDIDRKHKKDAQGRKVNATDAEREVLRQAASEVIALLAPEFGEPVFADSGNGFHISWRIGDIVKLGAGIPVEEAQRLYKRLLAFLKKKFERPDLNMEIDGSLADDTQVVTVWGTWNRKYPDTPERPQRQSEAISIPEHLLQVGEKGGFKHAQVLWATTIRTFLTVNKIEETLDDVMAEETQPAPKDKQKANQEWLENYGVPDLIEFWSPEIDYEGDSYDKNGEEHHPIAPCPCHKDEDFHEHSHKRDCEIIVFPDGGIGISCFSRDFGLKQVIKKMNEIKGEKYAHLVFEEPDPVDEALDFGAVVDEPEKTEPVLKEDERGESAVLNDPELAVVTVRASEVKMEKLEWLWQERIPLGKITWFCGLPDCGKTFVALDLVARVSSGRDFPDQMQNKWGEREVLLGVTEDGIADTVVPRLVAAGAKLQNVHIIKCVKPEEGDSKKKRMLMLKDDIVRMYRYLKANPQISLVVLDPLTSYLGEVDYNKDKEIRPVMDAVSALCEKTKVTLVAIMHLNKRSDVSAIHKILGASSVAGSARVAWGFSPDPEDRELKHMSLIKNNISKQRSGLDYKIASVDVEVEGEMVGHGTVEWHGVNDMNADDQMQHIKEVRSQKKEDRLIDKAVGFLRRRFAEKSEWKVGGDGGLYKLAEAEGLTDKQVKRARERLQGEGLRLDWDDRRSTRDGYWLVIHKDYVPDPMIPAEMAEEVI